MATATVSSKGQVTIPLDIREKYGLERGAKINIQSTPWGISIIKVPPKPLSRLKGILSGTNLPGDIKKIRKENDKARERVYHF